MQKQCIILGIVVAVLIAIIAPVMLTQVSLVARVVL